MAKVIVGNDQLFNAILYGDQQASTQRFLRKQYEDSEGMSGFSERFMERTRSLFEDFYDSGLASRTRAALRKIKTAFVPDDIRELHTIGEIQHARSIMRQFIMASPYVREMYRGQRTEGYGPHYEDPYPNWRTEDIPEYQHVMSGLVEVQEDGSVTHTNYLDVEYGLDENISITHLQGLDVYHTWENIKSMYKAGKEDPLSTVNAYL